MTVLIAQRTKDRIILGADTGVFQGDHVTNLANHRGHLKIMTINDITYSACGYQAESVNFGLFCQTRKPENSDQMGMQRFFNDFGKWLKDNGPGKEKIENNYFIVFEKRLFHYCHGATMEILEGDFRTDGAGYAAAYMAIHLGKSVKEAIKATIEIHLYARGEPQIVEIMLTNTPESKAPPPIKKPPQPICTKSP